MFSNDCELLSVTTALGCVKDHLFKCAASYSLFPLIIHSFISLCSPLPFIFWLYDLSLMDSAFLPPIFLSACLTHVLSFLLSSLWALIDISLLTFSFTLTLVSAALSDARVVWSFIRLNSLLFSILPSYSSLLPVLWKSSFALQNPCCLIRETPRPCSQHSSQRERIDTMIPPGAGQQNQVVCVSESVHVY